MAELPEDILDLVGLRLGNSDVKARMLAAFGPVDDEFKRKHADSLFRGLDECMITVLSEAKGGWFKNSRALATVWFQALGRSWYRDRVQPLVDQSLERLRTAGKVEFDSSGRVRIRKGVDASTTIEPPEPPLTGYPAIFSALKRTYSTEAVRQFKRACKSNSRCPIVFHHNGGPPKVKKSDLLAWAKQVDADFEAKKAKQDDARATTGSTYKQGRAGVEIVKDISGTVRRKI